MRKEPLNSKRLKLITTNTEELHDSVDALYECLVDGDFGGSRDKLEELKLKLKQIHDMVNEGPILKPKRRRI